MWKNLYTGCLLYLKNEIIWLFPNISASFPCLSLITVKIILWHILVTYNCDNVWQAAWITCSPHDPISKQATIELWLEKCNSHNANAQKHGWYIQFSLTTSKILWFSSTFQVSGNPDIYCRNIYATRLNEHCWLHYYWFLCRLYIFLTKNGVDKNVSVMRSRRPRLSLTDKGNSIAYVAVCGTLRDLTVCKQRKSRETVRQTDGRTDRLTATVAEHRTRPRRQQLSFSSPIYSSAISNVFVLASVQVGSHFTDYIYVVQV